MSREQDAVNNAWRIALPVPLRREFDYLPPSSAATPVPGSRVLVPFGPRRLVGVLLAAPVNTSLPRQRLRRVIRVLDEQPGLPADILHLCRWAAGYYHAPIGEVMQAALPVLLREERVRRPDRAWVPTTAAFGLGDDSLTRAPKQAAALAELKSRGSLRREDLAALGIDRSHLKALAGRGLAEEIETSQGCDLSAEPMRQPVPGPQLNAEQALASQRISSWGDHFHCILLHGVTGSGKTEVYLRAIAECLAADKQALVLIPEIGLTPQARQRYQQRLGDGVAVLHSALSAADRLAAWRAAGSGALGVLIGTRSAVFTPMPNLGLIIVDEEHDSSYKQQEGFRYSARDVAIYRAREANIPIVLGSATPSVESLAHAHSGRYQLLTLQQRAGGARPPEWQTVNIRHQSLDGGLSPAAIAAIGEELAAEHQVLVFLNRRGWSPVLMCHSCGWAATCPACDARLTLHREASCLWCHHCDRRQRVPTRCPDCQGNQLIPLGQGTERCEQSLQRLFPNVPVCRVDRGTTQRRDAMRELLETVELGRPMILVGTQMLAKGHDFPKVTLVVVLEADSGLFSAEYRAIERTAQLLEQVGGRAGRGERAGRVLVQTHHPDHPVLQDLITTGYAAVAERLISQRQQFALPPFSHFALLWLDCPDPDRGPALLRALRRSLATQAPELELIGPIPAPLRRRAGRFRDQLLFQAKQRSDLHRALSLCCAKLEGMKLPGNSRWSLDIDPIEGI